MCDKNNPMKRNRWDDHFTRRARDEKWLARSVYKLQEIDRKFKFIRKGYHIIDLGCYPGSWSQYGIRKVGPKGDVTGVDLVQPTALLSIPTFRFFQADVLKIDIRWLADQVGPLDLVLSDLAPDTTGIALTDVSRSMAMAGKTLEIARTVLKKGGHLVCKIFEGGDIRPFRSECSNHFGQVRFFRPNATRKRSREVYLIGLDRF